MLFGHVWNAGALWLAAALLLAIAEMMAPGFFLIFLGVGAAATGLAVLIAPVMPIVVQAIMFAIFTAGAVVLGRRWYRRPTVSADPLLNDRAARLIGKRVEVCEAIVDGEGRVRVGDGAWNAQGPDLPAGSAVTITGATGSVLHVAP